MHRRTDTQELNIPKDDIECWERYPKHHWMYDLSRLLDVQNIKWSPFEDPDLPDRELNIEMISSRAIVRQPGYIYIKKQEGPRMYTELYIVNGEIKKMRHINPETFKELDSLNGEIELRLNAFTTLHFQKFTGIITAETYANEIFRIRLRPYTSLDTETNQEITKLAKRIYKKTDIILSGLTDRVLHETLTS